MLKNIRDILAIALVSFGIGGVVHATPITVLVGDKDNYGGIASCGDNTSSCVFTGMGTSGEGYDGRGLAEMNATNGAQLTDVFSALFPGSGPNISQGGDVIFDFVGMLTSGTITIAMGDFQCTEFGATLASINDTVTNFCFQDGFHTNVTRDFALTAAEVAAANLTHQVILHINRNNNLDFIAFDWFQLNGNVVGLVPEPSTLALLAIALLGLGFLRRPSR